MLDHNNSPEPGAQVRFLSGTFSEPEFIKKGAEYYAHVWLVLYQTKHMTELQSEHTIHNVKLTLLQGNIVTVEADAIVNAANTGLAGGGGVDGAIHCAAGPSVMAQCRQIGGCPTGSAVATEAGNLKAKYIYHAVGPIYDYHADHARLLASAYQTCLDLAEQHQIRSIAFPSLSTGAFGYPLKEAAFIALRTVLNHIQKPTYLCEITFVLFGDKAYRAFEQTLGKILAG